MTTKIYNMTSKELDIKTVMDKLIIGDITEENASKLIKKSLRQTQRIKRKYKLEGVEGLIHKLRGNSSNHKYDETKYIQAIQIVKDRYNDYGPTLATEKLAELHNIEISIPILRREMIKAGIWKAKKRKEDKKQFTARERRESYGELVQYDGSYHMWFEGRDGTGYQCLLVSIDDATGEVRAKFAKNEGLWETFTFWKEYILEKGKPLAIYLDKFATYKVNYPDATDDRDLTTQFGRVAKDLAVQLIFANTPQAKGRVERMNQTLQDRLVKELRENNVSNIDAANKYLKEVFLVKFNKKFMVKARNEANLHTDLRTDEIDKLDQIFSEHKERKVLNDYTVKFENKYYQLYKSEDKKYILRQGQKVCVEKHLNGDIKISINGVYVESKTSFERPEKQNTIGVPRKKGEISNSKTNQVYENKDIRLKDIKEKEAKALVLAGKMEDPYYLIT